MTIKTLTTTLLLATSFLLFTACDSKVDTNTIGNQNAIVELNVTMPIDANNTTETNTASDDTTLTVPIISLDLTIDKTSLNKDENTTVKVMVTYSDNTTKDVTEEVEWISSKINVVKVTKYTLTALQDTQTTLQAKLGSTLSDKITLDIYWEVNGHTLPPEPDSQVNNSTLLGIDSNDNGVRDDVERWIYETYKDKHPIHIDIAMQGARAKQKMLKDPSKAKEIHDEMSAPLDCESYYKVCVDKPIIETRINSKYFRKIIFNTPDRKNAYLEYDRLLSGDSYAIPWCSERKQACDFNIGKYEK
jgi:hypothetical protein